MRIALPYPDPIADTFAAEFADLLNNKSGGELEAKVFGNGTLGNSDGLYEQLLFGAVDAALLPARRPFYTTGLTAPFTFPSFESAKPFFEAFESTEDEGSIALAIIPTDVMVLVSAEQFDPNDISSVSILSGRSDFAERFSNFERRSEPLQELLTRGVKYGSAAEAPLFHLDEPQVDPVVTRLDHRFVADVVLISRDFFDELSPELQQTVVDAVAEASKETLAKFETQLPQSLEKLHASGWNLVDRTPVTVFLPDASDGGDDCTHDEYLKKYNNVCKCERGDRKDECSR
ncbi:MAG: hypothetical protein GY798_26755 [Hyphomicrobiales bacterium]|nr:hypothetical protein [Hyphomicrobiales bacterium]